ncbi:MAG: hypothetical protein R3C02_03705 [Planctomycetaceae bacterium]
MMLVELHFDDRELLRIKSSSNRAHLLPFMVERNDGGENYNPEISIALAEMLPDGSMFRERLQSADRVFDSERELRAEFAKYDRKTGDRPQETNEQHMEKINATLNDMADLIDHGDDVEFMQETRL